LQVGEAKGSSSHRAVVGSIATTGLAAAPHRRENHGRRMSRPSELQLPIRAATETAAAHGVAADRCDILQDGHTLVLRLSESLVARVVTDRDGPRQGGEWFARESAVACHLARHGAPVIPMHPDIPPGPHERLGYTLNFWQFVTAIDAEPAPEEIGSTLHHCHRVLRAFKEPLPELGILFETLELLEAPAPRTMLSASEIGLLRDRLSTSLAALRAFPMQPLHGDAHRGNLMSTTRGLLWTDWEDTFLGPVDHLERAHSRRAPRHRRWYSRRLSPRRRSDRRRRAAPKLDRPRRSDERMVSYPLPRPLAGAAGETKTPPRLARRREALTPRPRKIPIHTGAATRCGRTSGRPARRGI
jgi:hypothetical protein